MGCLLFTTLIGAGCFIAAWVLFPEPKVIRDFWAAHGWADKD